MPIQNSKYAIYTIYDDAQNASGVLDLALRIIANNQGDGMGYRVKLQKVERPTNKSYYLNFPAAIAEALQAEKGEEFEWEIEDKNTLVLRRVLPRPPRQAKADKPE